MGRKTIVELPEIYAAIGSEIARAGKFTIQNLSASAGLSVGSLYHRFSSREELLAQAWIYAIKNFQEGFLAALRSGTSDAGERAALETIRFSRRHSDQAVILYCCRREEFLGMDIPAPFVDEIKNINKELEAEILKFSVETEQLLLRCQLAIIAYPLAAVRLYLPNKPVPKELEEEIRNTYRATMSQSSPE